MSLKKRSGISTFFFALMIFDRLAYRDGLTFFYRSNSFRFPSRIRYIERLYACTLAVLAIEELLSARDGEGLFVGLTASLIYVPLGLGIAYVFYQASTEAYGVGVGILWSFWVFKFPSFLFTDGDD